MKSSDTFRDFVLDQLAEIPRVRAQAMFGGIGVYAGDVFFALIASDVFYLKVDDTNRARFEAEGCRAFQPYPGNPMVMPYYNVPVGVLEHAETLVEWARISIGVAKNGRKVKQRRAPRT